MIIYSVNNVSGSIDRTILDSFNRMYPVLFIGKSLVFTEWYCILILCSSQDATVHILQLYFMVHMMALCNSHCDVLQFIQCILNNVYIFCKSKLFYTRHRISCLTSLLDSDIIYNTGMLVSCHYDEARTGLTTFMSIRRKEY